MREAYNWHMAHGGLEIRNPEYTLRRVLGDLKDERHIISVGHGYWSLVNERNDEPLMKDDAGQLTSVSDSEPIEQSGAESADEHCISLCPEIELGRGSECVYVYFNENDRRLAELEDRSMWECKVGRTGDSQVSNRILQQGVSTALSRPPTVGLVIYTNDSSLLERALHCSLRMARADYKEAIGSEWFVTSPEAIAQWFQHHCKAIDALKIDESVS